MLDFLLIAFGMFISAFFTDLFWAIYIRKVANNAKLAAAIYSLFIGFFSIVFIQGVIKNLWFSAFWLIGLFLGTYFSADCEKLLNKISKGKI